MPTTFHEVLFDPEISYGSSGGPKFKTTIFTADSGYEQRNIDWQAVRGEYDVGQSIKTRAQMDNLEAFFMNRRGRAFGFRFKDWTDFTISQQTIGTGTGAQHAFQLIKTYTSSQIESGETHTYDRKITKPNWNTVAGVTVDNVVKVSPGDYSVDYTTGIITFVVAPAAGKVVKVGAAEFHVPVRFDTDHLDVTQEFWETMTWPNIPLVEVRDWGEVFSA